MDIEEDEEFYKMRVEEQKYQMDKQNKDLKAISDDIVAKRTVIQDKFERVRPDKTVDPKTRPNTDDWLYEYAREDYYVNKEKEKKLEEEEKHKSSVGSLGGGFSNDLNKSNRSKRKKWSKNSNAVVMSTNIDPKLNSKTAAQLDRLANIQIEASKQDMIINEMYAKVKQEKAKSEELKSHLKPKKDKVKREKPVPNVPRQGLFSVENWLSKLDDNLPDELKNKIMPKKINVKKTNALVDRLTKQPEKGQVRKDPEMQELKHILNKYDTSEKRIGGGATKKAEYKNVLPKHLQKESPVVSKKNVKFVPSYSNQNSGNKSDIDTAQFNLTDIHKEEQKLWVQKKQLESIGVSTSQIATSKMSVHNTMVDNAFNEILGNDQNEGKPFWKHY